MRDSPADLLYLPGRHATVTAHIRRELLRELLAKADLAIAGIAQRTGFTEPAAFSRAFKKWAGVTPAQYREQKTA